MRTLVIGLGRSGLGLHLPVLARARVAAASRHLFGEEPMLAFDPYAADGTPPGTIKVTSLTEATRLAEPSRTVVHLCTPPSVRVELLGHIARLGFRKVLVEKPLASDSGDLAEITRLRRRWGLAVLVVAPWRASALTTRIEEILSGDGMGALRAISVVQRKPRFTRSLALADHHSVFDVEAPHAVGLAVALAGSARVRDAAWTDMRMGENVVPRMGTGWLSLDHDSGVHTELLSDLTSPTRERRITVELERGTLVGHYPSSERDHTAQLTVTADGWRDRVVFHDDALTTFMVHAYERFATSGYEAEPSVDAEVVRVLDEAKRRCQRRGHARLPLRPWRAAQQEPDRPAASAVAGGSERLAGRREAVGPAGATILNGPNGSVGTRRERPLAAGAGDGQGFHSAVRWAGIGDEAGVGLADQVGALARLGWTSIELRTVDGVGIADLGDEAFGRLVDSLQAQGFDVACVASAIGNWSRSITGDFHEDLRELDVLERRCAALGTRYVRVMSYPNAGLTEHEWGRRVVERMRRLAGRAEQAGLVLVHENCTGWAGTRAERMLALLDAVDSPALRLLFDTGNGVAHGYDGYDLLTQIVDHVTHVHVKDATGGAERATYTLPGAGRARVAECLRLLLTSGYTGTCSIEPHLAVQPHQVVQDHQAGEGGAAGADRLRDSFVASGRALERLVRDQVLPAVPEWTTAPGGIARKQER